MAVATLLLAGCRLDREEFPASIGDATYSNGHALALNGVDAADLRWEEELVTLTNARRFELGLPPLSRNRALDALARAHSHHMFEHEFFDHPNPEGDDPGGRLRTFASGSWTVRENIWIVEPGRDPQYVLNGFLNSPSHYEAIVSPSQLIGVGMVRNRFHGLPGYIYVTMEFVELP